MKPRYLIFILPISIVCGWWLNSRRAERPVIRTEVANRHVETIDMFERKPASLAPTREVRKLPDSVSEFVEELNRLKQCSEGNCIYPRTDARSYDFALAQDIKQTLFRFSEWVRNEKLESREAGEVAREFLAFDDGFVQSAALDLMSTQPPNQDNRDAILHEVIDGHDSELIEQAMLELERYTASDDRRIINQAFGKALMTGAPYVARAVSANIGPFVDARSFHFFESVLSQLPENSIYAEKLESSLDAFRSAQEG